MKWPKLKKTARSTMLGYECQCSVYRRKNKTVSSCRLNDCSDGAERTVSGRLFHVRGPATGNERSPTVTNRDRGTRRISVSADVLSRRLESTSETRCSVEDKYGGARSWRQRYTSVATLRLTRSTALNQCSSIKAGVTWSDHRRL